MRGRDYRVRSVSGVSTWGVYVFWEEFGDDVDANVDLLVVVKV
jgi:hypothetical protein